MLPETNGRNLREQLNSNDLCFITRESRAVASTMQVSASSFAPFTESLFFESLQMQRSTGAAHAAISEDKVAKENIRGTLGPVCDSFARKLQSTIEQRDREICGDNKRNLDNYRTTAWWIIKSCIGDCAGCFQIFRGLASCSFLRCPDSRLS